MQTDPQAEEWFAGKPAEPILRRVRDVILGADKRMAEGTKYGTVTFHFGGDFASFVQHDKKTVSLMFTVAESSPASTRTWRARAAPSASCASPT